MMPLSHDEVVHGKASMIYKMKGDEWQKFANLRTLYTFMYTHPGAKLMFMGNEIAQTSEWNFAKSLDWHLLEYPIHQGMNDFVKALNHLYRFEKSLYQLQFDPSGFEWVEANDEQNSVYVYLRKGETPHDETMTILNMTPRVLDYTIGVDELSTWSVILNSDEEKFGGSGIHAEVFKTSSKNWMNKPESIVVRLPALSGVVLKRGQDGRVAKKKRVSKK